MAIVDRYRDNYRGLDGRRVDGSNGNQLDARLQARFGAPRRFGWWFGIDGHVDSGLDVDQSLATAAMSAIGGSLGLSTSARRRGARALGAGERRDDRHGGAFHHRDRGGCVAHAGEALGMRYRMCLRSRLVAARGRRAAGGLQQGRGRRAARAACPTAATGDGCQRWGDPRRQRRLPAHVGGAGAPRERARGARRRRDAHDSARTGSHRLPRRWPARRGGERAVRWSWMPSCATRRRRYSTPPASARSTSPVGAPSRRLRRCGCRRRPTLPSRRVMPSWRGPARRCSSR